jgi:ABC-2 type transport system permease protein
VIRRVRKVLRIAWQLVRIGVVRKSQFRFEFLNQVLMDVMFYASHLLVFEILFGFEEGLSIAGWSHAETRVFLGMVFVHDAFMMTCLGQSWHFGEDLKDGKLDTFRVRPAPTVFLYFFQRFSPEGLMNMAIASTILLWGLSSPELSVSPWLPLLALWAIAIAFFAQTVVAVLYACAEFWFLNSDLGRTFSEVFGSIGSRPLDIYNRRVRMFFVLLVPIGFLAWLPASLMLGRIGPGAGLLHTAWIVAVGLLVFRLWNRGFRRYESAMG